LPDNQLTIAKETGRRLGIGTNMYPSSALLGQSKDKSIAALPVHDLIEKADGFAGVFPGMIQFNGGERHVKCSFSHFSRSQIRDYKMPASTCNIYLCIILGCFQT
jgi:hypothetical protein